MSLKNKLVFYGALHTLENAIKGGRINAIAGKIIGALNLKAIIHIADGLVKPIDKARGDKNSINKVIDYIKALGFKYSTLAGITFSVADVEVPAAKKEILAEADKQVEKVRNQYRRGLITDDERYQSVVNIWEKATNDVSKAMEENYSDALEDEVDTLKDLVYDLEDKISDKYLEAK